MVRRIFLEIVPRYLLLKNFQLNYTIDPLDIELEKDSKKEKELDEPISSTRRPLYIQSPKKRRRDYLTVRDDDNDAVVESLILRNALLTRELGESLLSLPASYYSYVGRLKRDRDDDEEREENCLLLVESDDAHANRRVTPKVVKRRKKRVKKAMSLNVVRLAQNQHVREKSDLERLVCRNIFYLDQIDSYIKKDFQTKKVNFKSLYYILYYYRSI